MFQNLFTFKQRSVREFPINSQTVDKQKIQTIHVER